MTGISDICCLAAVLLFAGTCFAARVDDDLREAARLRKDGDTVRAAVIWKSWAERSADAASNLAVIHR